MDYARFNYVAQPGDKGVKLTPPDLGVYDYYAIKWLYSPIPGNKSVKEEAKIVQAWVDEKAGDPMYRYGQQQVASLYDPSALTEDSVSYTHLDVYKRQPPHIPPPDNPL